MRTRLPLCPITSPLSETTVASFLQVNMSMLSRLREEHRIQQSVNVNTWRGPSVRYCNLFDVLEAKIFLALPPEDSASLRLRFACRLADELAQLYHNDECPDRIEEQMEFQENSSDENDLFTSIEPCLPMDRIVLYSRISAQCWKDICYQVLDMEERENRDSLPDEGV